MTNDEFLGLYAMLDGHHRAIGGDHFGLKSLHAGGMILFRDIILVKPEREG